MIKTKAKGSRLELKTRDILRHQGYFVTKSGGSLGQFDLIAMSCYWKPHWRLIQVKSNYCPPKERILIKDFKVPKGAVKEIWLWHDYVRKPEIETYK